MPDGIPGYVADRIRDLEAEVERLRKALVQAGQDIGAINDQALDSMRMLAAVEARDRIIAALSRKHSDDPPGPDHSYGHRDRQVGLSDDCVPIMECERCGRQTCCLGPEPPCPGRAAHREGTSSRKEAPGA